jgi:hypothetical protein
VCTSILYLLDEDVQAMLKQKILLKSTTLDTFLPYSSTVDTNQILVILNYFFEVIHHICSSLDLAGEREKNAKFRNRI